MKITKARLKQLIKEELGGVKEVCDDVPVVEEGGRHTFELYVPNTVQGVPAGVEGEPATKYSGPSLVGVKVARIGGGGAGIGDVSLIDVLEAGFATFDQSQPGMERV